MIKSEYLTHFLLFTGVSTIVAMVFVGNFSFVYFLSTLSGCMLGGLVWTFLVLIFDEKCG